MSFSTSLSLPLFSSVFLSLLLFAYLCLSLPLSASLSLSFTLFASLCLSFTLFHSISLSFTLSASLCFSLPLFSKCYNTVLFYNNYNGSIVLGRERHSLVSLKVAPYKFCNCYCHSFDC